MRNTKRAYILLPVQKEQPARMDGVCYEDSTPFVESGAILAVPSRVVVPLEGGGDHAQLR
jgi:hypothetical protein